MTVAAVCVVMSGWFAALLLGYILGAGTRPRALLQTEMSSKIGASKNRENTPYDPKH